MLRISLIIPTLNEREGLEHTAKDLPTSLFHEIILVDGGSTDGTAEYARSLGFTVLRQTGHEGMVRALVDGYKASHGDAVIVFTPDGNSLCAKLTDLCSKLEEGFDLVVMSRYKPPARSYDDDWITALGNRLFIALVNLLNGTSYTDVTVAYRGYSREAVERMNLPCILEEDWLRRFWWYTASWELASVIRAKKLRLKTTELDSIEPARVGGVRKVSWRNGIAALLQIVWESFAWSARRAS